MAPRTLLSLSSPSSLSSRDLGGLIETDRDRLRVRGPTGKLIRIRLRSGSGEVDGEFDGELNGELNDEMDLLELSGEGGTFEITMTASVA